VTIRRHASGAHHDDERGREVLAEAFLPLEPELVDAIAPIVPRCERVAEAVGADVLEHGLRELGRRGAAPRRIGAKGARPRHRARIEAGRQLEAFLDLADAARRAEDEARARGRLESQPLEHGLFGEPLQVLARDHPITVDRCHVGGRLEERDRREAQRLERHFVCDRCAARLQRGRS